MEEFDEYIGCTDKCKSLFTIIAWNIVKEELINKLRHKLNLLKNVRDPYKRTYNSNRMYNFISYVESMTHENICHIYLVGDEINEFPIKKKYTKVLNDFNVNNFIMKNDNTFAVQYLKDLFLDTSFIHVVCVKNNDLVHIHLNKTKRRTHFKKSIKNDKLEDYVNVLQDKCVIHGVSSHLKKIQKIQFGISHSIFTNVLNDDEIFDVFYKGEMLVHHKKLEDCLTLLNRSDSDMNKIIFGKEIVKGITGYLIKTLFCIPKVADKIRKQMKEYINFELIEVVSLEDNDIAYTLEKDYMGAIGIKYY